MTEIATAEQQLEVAAGSASAKLQAFDEGLTPDEQRALALALRCLAAGGGDPNEDTAGHTIPGGPPLIAVTVAQQVAVRALVNQVLQYFGAPRQ
jgi:hypothetical protein